MGSNPILAAGRWPFGVTDTSRLAGPAPRPHNIGTTPGMPEEPGQPGRETAQAQEDAGVTTQMA